MALYTLSLSRWNGPNLGKGVGIYPVLAPYLSIAHASADGKCCATFKTLRLSLVPPWKLGYLLSGTLLTLPLRPGVAGCGVATGTP